MNQSLIEASFPLPLIFHNFFGRKIATKAQTKSTSDGLK